MALLPNSSPMPYKFLHHRVPAAHSIAREKAETRSEFVVATLRIASVRLTQVAIYKILGMQTLSFIEGGSLPTEVS